MPKRQSGILLHLTSLPSTYAIGDMGPCAYAFIDFLVAADQKLWQILPINPTDGINGYSPYSCSSAFAGNPLLISPQLMLNDGFLVASDLGNISLEFTKTDYDTARSYKEKIFNTAFRRFLRNTDRKDFDDFLKKEKYWIEDFALFSVIKSLYQGRSWNEWPKPLKIRQPKALSDLAKRYAERIEEVKFIQYVFYKQWNKLKAYAALKKIAIIGDIPIYVNYDSVDVWRYPSFFKLDTEGELKFISGCPPDYFSRTGQRWGNPVYNWANLKKAKYSWWFWRIAHDLAMFDYLRIDHFRGFASFWQIPAHEKLAVFGRWVKGPGEAFFLSLAKQFKRLPIIAEDLGEITPDVIQLMKKFGFPGMRVLLFAFNGDLNYNPHVPANYPLNSVAYSGTHDNNTIQGWYKQEAKAHEKVNIAQVLQTKVIPRHLHWQMIDALMQSKAETVIIPLQDFLGLAEEGRMNTPATRVNNWQWRLNPNALTARLARKIEQITKKSGR